jgi:predicted outer membrane lipoprotein
MKMKWLLLIISACAIGVASALAFSLMPPQTHNVGALFGDALVGVVVLIATLIAGWSGIGSSGKHDRNSTPSPETL